MLKEKKLAIVFTAEILGGHELMAIKHIKRFISKGYQITSYIPKNNIKLKESMEKSSLFHFEHEVKHRRLEIIHTLINPNYKLECIRLMRKLCDDFDYVILVQGDIELGSGLINAAYTQSKKNVVSYIPYSHSFKKMGGRLSIVKDFLAKKIYKKCTSYITICNQFKEDLKRKSPKSNVRILKNFVEKPIDWGKPVESGRQQTGDKNLTILMAGRIYFRQKGQDTLICALKNIRPDIHIKLRVIGDGPDMNKLIELAGELKGNVDVDFQGWKSDVWSNSFDTDVVVIPSNYEGVPLIMLEAQKRNVPIIAAARDGMLDYIPREYLYQTGGDEYIALAGKIEQFYDEIKSFSY